MQDEQLFPLVNVSPDLYIAKRREFRDIKLCPVCVVCTYFTRESTAGKYILVKPGVLLTTLAHEHHSMFEVAELEDLNGYHVNHLLVASYE